jgi:hypothetical protein
MPTTTKEEARVKSSAAWENSFERERAMRFGADRICLWCLCADAACRRAKRCRRDVRACASRMTAWLAAIEDETRARPDFATMECQIETAQELRAYRAWRRALTARRCQGLPGPVPRRTLPVEAPIGDHKEDAR